jgi:hypothetical protein
MKRNSIIKEEISAEDKAAVVNLIRKELARLFLVLYMKKQLWGADK